MKDKDIRKTAKDGELQKLRTRNKRLEKENKRLRSELNSFTQAFKKTEKFLRDHTEEISIQELIEAAKQGKSLKDAQQEVEVVCPKCFSKLNKLTYSAGTVSICTNNICDYRSLGKNESDKTDTN